MSGSPSNQHPILSYQPLKFLFQLASVVTIVARIPLWSAEAFIPRLRPRPKWTAKQTLLTRLAYALTDINGHIGVTETLSLEPGSEGVRFQVIEPSSAEFYQGPLQSSHVKPATVGGTWTPKPPLSSSATIILYLHGGAFIQGDGRDSYCGYPTRTMAKLGRVDAVFSLQYRLSGYAGLNPFPAALQDALTAYLFLLRTLKVPSQQIVLCGDSAGGNIAIALLRYIHEYGAELGISPPRCAALISPWVAPFNYHHNSTNNPRWTSDFLPNEFLRWGAHAYAAGVADGASDAYITPLGNPFPVAVPTFVNVGTAEIFFDDIKAWAGEMKKAANAGGHGGSVELREEDAAVHDTFLLAEKLGWEESAGKVISAMGKFIRRSA